MQKTNVRLPSVRANLFEPSWLKPVAVGMAVAAGILEEAMVRRMLMNALQHRGAGMALQAALRGEMGAVRRTTSRLRP